MNLLVKHDERALAPAAGVDVFAVLAHARQADKLERTTGIWVAVLWVLFALADLFLPHVPFACHAKNGESKDGGTSDTDFLSIYNFVFGLPYDWFFLVPEETTCELDKGFWVFNYACVSLALWLTRSISSRARSAYDASGQASGRRGGFLFALIGPVYLLVSYWAMAFLGVWTNPAHWTAVAFPLLLAAPVWVHRRAVERRMCHRFHPDTFEQRSPERLTGPAWLQRVGTVIKTEQDSKIALYDVDRGFTGLGRAVSAPVPLVTDLKHKPDADPEPLTSAEVLGRIRDELEEFRRDTGPRPKVDRLREVQVDELVYLPAKPPRASVDHGEEATRGHLREAAEEGGEARRHYLRARIGAWEQQVAVTALVRVYTQGKSLTLEVCLYVMDPLQPEFALVDAIAEQGPDLRATSVAQALLAAPGSGLAAIFSAARSAGDTGISVKRRFERWKDWDTPSQGASGSVRELAAAYKESPILRMDVNRYVDALVERIATGGVGALRERGYDTGQLEQQVIQVRNGGIHIGAMSGGAVATGQGARARTAGARTAGAPRQAGARALRRRQP